MTQVSTETPAPVSVGEVVAETAMNIYPNPATNTVNITLPGNESKATFDIVSINGQVVFSQEVSTAKTSVDVTSFPTGLYTVKMKLANGTSVSGKMTIE